LHFLRRFPYPLLVAHFNHRLRPAADSDAEFVWEAARVLDLPFVSDSADVAAHARDAGQSLEQAARELRYRFLFRAAREAGAQAVATGHTADDQAETVLMHFLRGAGLSGLKGMPPRVLLPVFDAEIPLVRPLLTWTRADTEAYCHKHGISYLTDATNADTTYFRNRLRHQLLPELQHYNPQIRQTLAKTAHALQGDYELLDELVEAAWRKSLRETGDGFVAFERSRLTGLSPALRRNLLRKAAFALQPGLRDVDFDALERAAALRPGSTDVAGGLAVLVEAATVFVLTSGVELPSAEWPQVPVSSEQLAVISGENPLGNGWILTCELTDNCSLSTDNWSAALDAGLTEGRLEVRRFRSGDRLEPLGMSHQSIKVADLFINEKIPQRARKNWPLVCVDDEIAWVPGLRMAEKFKVTEKTRQVVKLQLKRLP
jgi:tRNA(Ile)-lysidine synthase